MPAWSRRDLDRLPQGPLQPELGARRRLDERGASPRPRPRPTPRRAARGASSTSPAKSSDSHTSVAASCDDLAGRLRGRRRRRRRRRGRRRTTAWSGCPTRRISPLGTCHTVPSWLRSTVVRSVTRSTEPVATPRSTTSPMPYWSSISMNRPGDAVLDQVLGAEADGDAGDAGPGDQRGQVDAELAEDEQRGRPPRSTTDDRRGHDGRDRRGPGLPPRIVDGRHRRRHADAAAAPGVGRVPVGGDDAVRPTCARVRRATGTTIQATSEDDEHRQRPADQPVGELRQRASLPVRSHTALHTSPGSSPHASTNPPSSGRGGEPATHRGHGSDGAAAGRGSPDRRHRATAAG